jgi:hypothetical protein
VGVRRRSAAPPLPDPWRLGEAGTLGAVAATAEHRQRAVLRAAGGDWYDVVGGQVHARMGWALPARAQPAVGDDVVGHGLAAALFLGVADAGPTLAFGLVVVALVLSGPLMVGQ